MADWYCIYPERVAQTSAMARRYSNSILDARSPWTVLRAVKLNISLALRIPYVLWRMHGKEYSSALVVDGHKGLHRVCMRNRTQEEAGGQAASHEVHELRIVQRPGDPDTCVYTHQTRTRTGQGAAPILIREYIAIAWMERWPLSNTGRALAQADHALGSGLPTLRTEFPEYSIGMGVERNIELWLQRRAVESRRSWLGIRHLDQAGCLNVVGHESPTACLMFYVRF
ncbi:hypothetical protein LXA43DRAFT_574155 [Ganoderma leucocontextum]|nr:hypothetical protein LXA43DRAFT_574155 [Ganoderma leucocontextum]